MSQSELPSHVPKFLELQSREIRNISLFEHKVSEGVTTEPLQPPQRFIKPPALPSPNYLRYLSPTTIVAMRQVYKDTSVYFLFFNGRRIYPFDKGLRIYGGVYHPPFDTLKIGTSTDDIKLKLYR